jgi:hypothetical protein
MGKDERISTIYAKKVSISLLWFTQQKSLFSFFKFFFSFNLREKYGIANLDICKYLQKHFLNST